jgi:hypothetical protein
LWRQVVGVVLPEPITCRKINIHVHLTLSPPPAQVILLQVEKKHTHTHTNKTKQNKQMHYKKKRNLLNTDTRWRVKSVPNSEVCSFQGAICTDNSSLGPEGVSLFQRMSLFRRVAIHRYHRYSTRQL